MTETPQRTRYRFAEFTLSPSRRLLLRGDTEVPLIPRYFDLLVLLVERRNEAVNREEIFDKVWNDVIVSDGAMTQAIRILRKSLGDPAKDPRFIRTVSRHGYQFIYDDITEEPDIAQTGNGDTLEQAIAELMEAEPPKSEEDETRLRDAAETVLRLGAEEDLSRINDVARALLRDVRWDMADASFVPLLGSPGSLTAIRALLSLRIRRTWKLIRKRWIGATMGGVAAGIVGGTMGALVLLVGPGSRATSSVVIALPLVGAVVGGLGALGVGGGLAWAEALVRSYRMAALILLGAAGGGLVGSLTHFVGRFTIEGLFGRDLSPVGGGFEGLVLGAAVGAGYALATPVEGGGMATPRGKARWKVAAAAGLSCSLSGIVLALSDHHLGAMSLDFMAQSFPGSQVSLDPLARLLGETTPGVTTRIVISSLEGFLFGVGVVAGLTKRPRRRRQTLHFGNILLNRLGRATKHGVARERSSDYLTNTTDRWSVSSRI